MVLAVCVPLAALGGMRDERVVVGALSAWLFVWTYGAMIASRVTPFAGPFLGTVRRR